MKIKKNDNVIVIAGRDLGKSGVVDAAFPKEQKVVVKGVGVYKKHIKPSRKNPRGGIIDINRKIDSSNLSIVCPSCGKPTRVGYKLSDKNKIRICRKCSQSIEISATK